MSLKNAAGAPRIDAYSQSVLLSPEGLFRLRVYQGCCIIRHIYLPFSETLALLQPVANVTRMLSPMLTWSLLRSIVPSAA